MDLNWHMANCGEDGQNVSIFHQVFRAVGNVVTSKYQNGLQVNIWHCT